MFRFVHTALAIAILSSPAWAQEKVLDKTQAEWVKILQDKDKEKRLRRASVLALKRFDSRTKETMTALKQALGKDAEPEVRRDIAVMLGGLGVEAKDCVEALAQRLTEPDPDPKVREAAARALGKLHDYAILHPGILGKALSDPDADTRLAAADALVLFGDFAKPALPQLASAAGDVKMAAAVRMNAVRILAKLSRDEKTAELLGGILIEKDIPLSLRQTTATALSSMGPAALPAAPMLAQIMENKDKLHGTEDKEEVQLLRRTAGVALGRIGVKAKAALPVVMNVMDDPDLALRSQAIRLAGMFGKGNPEVARRFVKLLHEEKNAEVLVAAIQETADLGLGKLGTLMAEKMEAETHLKELERDPRLAVREAAMLTLKKLKETR